MSPGYSSVFSCLLSFRKLRRKPNLESTSKYGFSPDLGEKMAVFWAWACKLSWTLFSRARVQPLHGAGRKESSGTGLLENKFYTGIKRKHFRAWNTRKDFGKRNVKFSRWIWNWTEFCMLGVMKLRVFFYIACLTWTSLYGMSGCHYWHPVIQQDQLSVETEVNYKITPPLIESD